MGQALLDSLFYTPLYRSEASRRARKNGGGFPETRLIGERERVHPDRTFRFGEFRLLEEKTRNGI
jgi:hypothetical protein